MKKLLVLVLSVLLLALAVQSFAESATEVVTFGWTQEDVTNLKEWDLMWSDTAGGPYVSVTKISYDASNPAGDFTSPATATVNGEQGTNVVKYFIMKACGDIPQADNTTVYECSAPSNEISYSFWIPAGKFSVPVQFRVIAQ